MLIYSFIARTPPGAVPVVLVEHSDYRGNFNTIALECLQKLGSVQNRFTILCDRHTFNFLERNGLTYLVVADEAYGRQIPFAFLERVMNEFEDRHGEKAQVLPAHSLDRTFGPRLRSHMRYCMAHPGELERIAAVQQKVNDVQKIMIENIEKVLERGEKLELLVDKTAVLQMEALRFKGAAEAAKTQMWWHKWRMTFAVIFALMLLAVVLFVSICFSGGNCLADHNSSHTSLVFLPPPSLPPPS